MRVSNFKCYTKYRLFAVGAVLVEGAMSVQIAIDNYDDLFSDFDIRGYEERYFSSDFLNELRMRTIKLFSKKELEIVFVIDKTERNATYEAIISGRLKLFFNNRYERNNRKRKKLLFDAVLLEIVGIAFMLITMYLEKYDLNYFKEFMLIPSWFFIWNGLEKYIYNAKILDKKVAYYSKLKKAAIRFEDIG